MSQTITLASQEFTAARLRRIGGELIYDDLVPIGAEVVLVYSLGDVASMVMRGGGLVSIHTWEITDETVKPGTILKRTGRPFSAIAEYYAPPEGELIVDFVSGQRVWYDGINSAYKAFKSCYLTTGYFDIVSP